MLPYLSEYLRFYTSFMYSKKVRSVFIYLNKTFTLLPRVLEKKYFIIDQKIVRYFAHFSECLFHPHFLLCKISTIQINMEGGILLLPKKDILPIWLTPIGCFLYAFFFVSVCLKEKRSIYLLYSNGFENGLKV